MIEILLLIIAAMCLIIFVQSYLNNQLGNENGRLRKMLHQCQKEKAEYHRALEAVKPPLLQDVVDFEWPEYTVNIDEVV